MQVFMPYTNITQSVKCLDNKRLGKQRIEIKYMLEMMYGMWPERKHPVITMWEDYPNFLHVIYYNTVCEWIDRGCKNTLPVELEFMHDDWTVPPWLEDYTYQYKALLLHKDYEFYSKEFGTDIEPISKIPYLTKAEIKEIYNER